MEDLKTEFSIFNDPKYKLMVYIYQRPFLRCDNLEYEKYIGTDVLKSMFDKMEMRPDVKTLFLSFPEQWLNIIEQRQLYNRIDHYCPNIEDVTIKTHSVYIIQCTRKENCGIITIEGDMPQETDAVDQKLYVENAGNIFDMTKLNVV